MKVFSFFFQLYINTFHGNKNDLRCNYETQEMINHFMTCFYRMALKHSQEYKRIVLSAYKVALNIVLLQPLHDRNHRFALLFLYYALQDFQIHFDYEKCWADYCSFRFQFPTFYSINNFISQADLNEIHCYLKRVS